MGKRSNIINYNKSILILFYKTLCVFFQIKDVKHIEQDYCSDAWVMQHMWEMWKQGVPRGQMDTDDELNRMQVNFSLYCHPGDLGVRSKGRISLNFNYKIEFKVLCTKLCVCSHKYIIKHIKLNYYCAAWVMPQG